MKQRQPQSYVMIQVPNCEMHGAVDVDGKLIITLGWPKDFTTLQFKRRALRRFIDVASDLLETGKASGRSATDT